MYFSVELFYNFFLCGKRAFLCGESTSSLFLNVVETIVGSQKFKRTHNFIFRKSNKKIKVNTVKCEKKPFIDLRKLIKYSKSYF